MGECNAVVIVPVYFINWRNIWNSTLGWSFLIWMFVISGMPLHLTTFIWTMFSKHLVHIQIFGMLVIFKVSFVGSHQIFVFPTAVCIPSKLLHTLKCQHLQRNFSKYLYNLETALEEGQNMWGILPFFFVPRGLRVSAPVPCCVSRHNHPWPTLRRPLLPLTRNLQPPAHCCLGSWLMPLADMGLTSSSPPSPDKDIICPQSVSELV